MEALLCMDLPTVQQPSLSKIPSWHPATCVCLRLHITSPGGHDSLRHFHQSNLRSRLSYMQVPQ